MHQRNKMKKTTKLALAALFGFAMLSTTANAASVLKGQKIYAKKIKGQCDDKTGGAFAEHLSRKNG